MAYVIQPWLYKFMRDHSTQINFAKAVELLRLVRKITKSNRLMANTDKEPLLVIITALSSFLPQQTAGPCVGTIELRNVLDTHLNPTDAFYVDYAIRALSYPRWLRPKEFTNMLRVALFDRYDLWESMLDIIDDARRIIVFDIEYEIIHMQKAGSPDDIIAGTVLNEISSFASSCNKLFQTKAGQTLARHQLESARATYSSYYDQFIKK